MNIEVFDSETPRFWLLMGHFFAHREYAREMGGWQFYTKAGSVWFVAVQDENVIGFCSAINERHYWFFDNFYVLPAFRGKGVGSALHEARMDRIRPTGREIRVISDNPIQHRKYLQQGFGFDGMRGRYSKFKLQQNETSNSDKNAGACSSLFSCAESVEP